jgi:glyoxylase-like metal-dependent hydrolase (beta-lactamase superfamily II)
LEGKSYLVITMLEIVAVPVTPLEQNCYLVYRPKTQDTVVIDPGGDVARIIEALSSRSLVCRQIWLTHSHFDHCGGVAALKNTTGAALIAHSADAEFRAQVTEICRMFGVAPGDMQACPEPDHPVCGGETLILGDCEFKALYTPGHARSHLCFSCENAGIVFTGDLLFAGSVGRTDLPGGSHKLLMKSIKDEILTLAPGTRIFPGHGPSSTVASEMASNPYLNGEYNG